MRRVLSYVSSAILIVLMIAGIERGLSNLYWNAIPTEGDLTRLIKRDKYLAMNGSGYDILILGDSVGAYGVIPDRLDQATGLNSYNFATTAGEAPFADVYLLEEYLAHHSSPKAIVVVRALHSWSYNTPADLAREHFEKPGIRYVLYQAGISTLHQLITSLAAATVPSYDHRNNLHRILSSLPRKFTVSMFFRSPSIKPDPLHGYTRENRAMSLPDVRKTIGTAHQDALHSTYLPSDENLVLLKSLCNLATEHRVPMLVVSSPYMAEMQEDAAFTGAMLKLNTTISDTFAGQTNCSWYGAEPMEHNSLCDLVHTNHTGAIIFTQQIADLLKNGIRWK